MPTVTCPSCATALSLPDGGAGPFVCPKCQTRIDAPSRPAPPLPAEAPAMTPRDAVRGAVWLLAVLVSIGVWALGSRLDMGGVLALLAVLVIATALDAILRIAGGK